MGNSDKNQINLEERIKELELENSKLKARLQHFPNDDKTVNSPEAYQPIFSRAEKIVRDYFKTIEFEPSKGTITINDERYVLIRASALSYDFFKELKQLYRDEEENDAFDIGQNFLFDIGHVIGKEDAMQFHKKMKLTNPIEKMAAGPVHFAYSGWAYVEILPESSPTPDENFFLKYNHPYSFEADSWITKGKKSKKTVCIMNAAYSSGWCAESYGIDLTAVEITCKAKGDEHCTFIMAPPHKIEEHLAKNKQEKRTSQKIPVFFERKNIERTIKQSLEEKETLLKEIHHRVKNNLQIVTSLLNLQFKNIDDPIVNEAISKSKDRINSMALVHTKLYQSNDLGSINFGEYIVELTNYLTDSYTTSSDIKCKVKHPDVFFDIDLSINLGLIITELLTNAYKHAFKNKTEGVIQVELKELGNHKYHLMIADNGIGLPNNLESENPEKIGLEIVNALTEQINGTIELFSNKGVKYIIQFEV